MKLPLIKFDCTHFTGDMPCKPNKLYGVFCNNCTHYEKDVSIDGNFPFVKPVSIKQESGSNISIAIIKLDAAGDVLRTTSILPSLKTVFPNSTINWVTKETSSPVLIANNFINELFTIEYNKAEFMKGRYNIAINLDTGYESCEIMSSINADTKYGYELVNNRPYPVNELANEWYMMGIDDNTKKQNKKTYYRIIHEICGLEYHGSQPVLNLTCNKKERANEIRKHFALDKYKELILINLGGGNRWQYKKWTKEGYSELISSLSQSEPGKAIGIIAGTQDIDFYNEVISLIPENNNIVLFGCNNPVEDFICIVHLSGKIFTSDSLAFHIATALDKYVVVITGPTSYTELDVFGKGKIVHSSKVNCLVCYLNRCDKVINCMNTVSVKDIASLLR